MRPGKKITADEIIVSSSSAVDVSMLTGESVLVKIGRGNAVMSATMKTGGHFILLINRFGNDIPLAQMAKLVEATQSSKAEVQRLADRVCRCVCFDRHRYRTNHLRGVARFRFSDHRGADGGGRGADHLLPLCAWASDFNRTVGRYRSRGSIQCSHQRP